MQTVLKCKILFQVLSIKKQKELQSYFQTVEPYNPPFIIVLHKMYGHSSFEKNLKYTDYCMV